MLVSVLLKAGLHKRLRRTFISGDPIEISEPIGCVDMSPWTDTGSELLMLAAGTGLTPMVNIIRERLRRLQKEGSDT